VTGEERSEAGEPYLRGPHARAHMAESPLDPWRSLVGEWRGTTPGEQFGEKAPVEDVATYSMDLGERFLLTRGEARCEGRLLNRSLAVMFYDKAAGKFRRETFFSYGFVNHETETSRTDAEILFDVRVEPEPKEFEGMRWRSFLRRSGEDEISAGLEVAKGDGPFESYGEVRLVRQPPKPS